MTAVPPLVGRIAALALAAGVVALIVTGLVVPFAERLASLDQQKRIAAAAVQRLTIRIGDRDGFAQRLNALKMEVAASDTHVKAATPAIGSAVVQRLLAEAAARNGVRVASVQVLPGTAEAGFQRIALQADLQGPFPGMAALLHDLESGRPYVFVEAVDIEAHSGAQAGEEAPLLSVRADLVAYMMEPQT